MEYETALVLLEEMQNIRKEEWTIQLNISLAPNMKKQHLRKFAKSISPVSREMSYSKENMKRFLGQLKQ